MPIEITGPGPDVSQEDEERVDDAVSALTPIHRAALETLLGFQCHGSIQHPSPISGHLERVLTEAYGDDLKPMLANIFARLR